jgi:hypothetical protein
MAPLEIHLGTLSQITLRLDDILPHPPYRGAIGASMLVLFAEVDTPDLSGRRRFSVPAAHLESWLEEMEQFEQRRTGEVTFSDEDGMAFQLVFSATDRAGHIAVSVELRWGGVVTDSRWQEMLVMDTVPIDPSTLPGFVDTLRDWHHELIAQHPPTRRSLPRE